MPSKKVLKPGKNLAHFLIFKLTISFPRHHINIPLQQFHEPAPTCRIKWPIILISLEKCDCLWSPDLATSVKPACFLLCVFRSFSSPIVSSPCCAVALFIITSIPYCKWCGMLSSRLYLTSPLRRGLRPAIINPARPLFAMKTTPLSGPSLAMQFTSRSLTTSPPPITSKSSKWIRIVPVAAVVGAAVFFFTNSTKADDHSDANFDTEKLYASKSTANIAFSWMILKLCSYDFIVNNGPHLLEWMNKYPLLLWNRSSWC